MTHINMAAHIEQTNIMLPLKNRMSCFPIYFVIRIKTLIKNRKLQRAQ